jgi:PIN domain
MLEKTIKQPIRLVALDTEVFDKANFNFQSKIFQKLIELVRAEKISIYLTTITHQEISEHIHRKAKQAASGFKKLHKDFREQAKIIYYSSKFQKLLNLKLEEEELLNELREQFSDFIEKSQIEILSIKTVSPEDIFAKYFKSIAPFHNGQKKHEFPDAFALAAIEEKAKKENRKIYVISGDKDWLEASNQSEHLIYKESIDKLLEDIIAQECDEIHLCYKIFEDNLEVIKEEISSIFIEGEFSLSDDFAYGYHVSTLCISHP